MSRRRLGTCSVANTGTARWSYLIRFSERWVTSKKPDDGVSRWDPVH